MKDILQPPIEPPIPGTELEVFFNIGQMTFHFINLYVFIIIMIYSYRVLKDIIPVIVVYSFSLLVGINSIGNPHPPISPIFEIFFLIFQTSIMILTAINKKDNYKIKNIK